MFESRAQKQRHKLATEFSRESGYTTAQIERVLAAFPDPNVQSSSPDGFFQAVTSSLITGRTSADRQVRNAVQSVHRDIASARSFNDTYIGHELSTSATPAIIATAESARRNGNTVATEVSKAESALEPEAIRGLLEIVGFDPDQGSGTFTSGGSLANMTALAVARKVKEAELRKARKVEEKTLRDSGRVDEAEQLAKKGFGKMVVLTTPFAHYSVRKACNLLAGPNNDIQVIEVASEGLRMSPKDLEAKMANAEANGLPVMAVVAIAGETETGLVDDLNAIADITEAHSAPMIVDGAYGAPYRMSRVGEKFAGMERAFAVTLDPHKALYTPYANGAVLFRNIEDHALLGEDVYAPYIGVGVALSDEEHSEEEIRSRREKYIQAIRDGKLGSKRIEGSMGTAPILSTVAVLRTLGREGLATVYDLTLDRINHLYERIDASEFLTPIHIPDINLLCFTLNRNTEDALGIDSSDALKEFIERTRNELDKDVQGEGGYFFSATELPLDTKHQVQVKDEFGEPKDKTKEVRDTTWAYRACIMNPRTTNAIIDKAVAGLEQLIQQRIDERSGVAVGGRKRGRGR